MGTTKFRIVQCKNKYIPEVYNSKSDTWHKIGAANGYRSPYYAKVYCVKYKQNELHRVVIDEFNL